MGHHLHRTFYNVYKAASPYGEDDLVAYPDGTIPPTGARYVGGRMAYSPREAIAETIHRPSYEARDNDRR